jgi:predicted N-acetyltransferase YhbS
LGKNLLDVGTVGEVATLPEFQRQVIATRLLKAAIREAENSPARFLLLFGKPPLYTRAGFHPATNPMVHVDMLGAVTGEVMREPSTFLMVRPLGAETWGDGVILDLLGPKF